MMTSDTKFQTYEEGCVVRNYRELQFNNFAIDSTSKRLAATIQRSIAILDLDNPDGPQPLRKLGRQNKYDIRVLEWNHSVDSNNLLASTSQYKLDIWDAVTSRDPLHSVKAHTRVVSDLNWSYSDSNCLASCSVDSYVYTWDVRDLRKPKLSFKAVAGASCVKWNRLDSHTLASAHDSDVRIWDSRNPSTAVGYISAHVSKIYGLDWSYLNNKGLTTWSQDASVKLWDISTPRDPVHVLKGYALPVWRALNTPFGHGLALSLAQHIHGSGDERVFLQNFTDLATPLHIFTGHSDSILDIQWRITKKDNYSLVSWSRDSTLRIWDITPAMKEGCLQSNDEEKTKSPPPSTLPIVKPKLDTTSGYSPSTPSDSVFSQQPVQTLEQEFSLLNLDIPNIVMERLEVSQRSCTVKIHNDTQLVRLNITFPSHYPNAAPGFILDTATNIDTSQQQELIQKLQDNAQSFMKQGKPCLQNCIKLLANTLQLFSARPAPPVMKPNAYELTTLQDDIVPFARTSGARFCSCGILIVFNRPRGLVLPTMEGKQTPRTMSMYKFHIHNQGAYVSPTTSSINNKLQVPSTSWRTKKHQPYVIKEPHRKMSKNPYVGLVMVMDASSLLPVSRDLANNYILKAKSIEEMCQQNAAVALSAGRPDLVKTWSIAAMVANTSGPMATSPDDDECPWPIHPFARPLIQSLFSYYTHIYDIQTLAMLSCVFQAYDNSMKSAISSFDDDDDGPNGFTIVAQQPKIGSPKHNNEFGDFENPEEEELELHKMNCRLLDHQLTNQCNEMIRCYSNVLYCWKLFNLRAELLSFDATKDKQQTKISFLNHCNKCIHPVSTPSCEFCRALSLSCSICHVAVKGISSFCPQCCHGGHLFHMLDWFDKNSECPSGCGCSCSRVSYVTQTSN